VCLCLSPPQHYCRDTDVTWGNGRGALCALLGGFANISAYRCKTSVLWPSKYAKMRFLYAEPGLILSSSIVGRNQHCLLTLLLLSDSRTELNSTEKQGIIVDVALRARCCPLVNRFEYRPIRHISIAFCLADYGQTLRHQQNRKYITYRAVVRGRPSRSHRKFREVWTCRF